MKPLNFKALDVSTFDSIAISGPINADFMGAVSALVIVEGTIDGTIIFQVSNSGPVLLPLIREFLGVDYLFVNIDSTALTISGAGTYLMPPINAAYDQIQIAFQPDQPPATITTVADVSGSLASAYFSFSDDSHNQYAIWFKVSGSGIDPGLGGGVTSIEVDISTNASAATIATAIASAISSNIMSATASALSNVVSVTGLNNFEDSAIPVSTVTTNGDVSGSLRGTYFLATLSATHSPLTDIYVWITVDGTGSDPGIPDRQSIGPVDIPDSSGGTTIATDISNTMNSAIVGHGFTSTHALHVITLTNMGSLSDGAGPLATGFAFAALPDISTGFTFDQGSVSGTVTAYLQAQYY